MIKISREDIATDYLQKFPVEERFIKLDIEAYLGLIGIEPIASQTALINAINNPKYRFVTAALSRRQGKTYIANIIGQVVALVPGCNILIMSPKYSLSQISFDLQRQLIRKFDLEVTRDNAKDKIIELSNGSTIRMGSVSQVDSCVGRSYDLIIFDEAALENGEQAFNVALRPTLDKDNSKAIFISTPRGKNNWFANFWNRGFDNKHPEWASIQATWHENPRVSEEDIEQARREMSSAEFQQEYEADFNIFEGQIWNLNTSECVQDLTDLRNTVLSMSSTRYDIFAGLDVGFRDPTAFVVIVYDWDTKMYYLIDEYLEAELTTDQHAENIRKMVEGYRIDFTYIDAAAQQTKFDFAQNYDISTINAKKSINDGIGHVASIIDNNRLIIDSTCRHTLASIDQYQWDPNPNLLKEKPKHTSASHIADALRYALYSFEASDYTF